MAYTIHDEFKGTKWKDSIDVSDFIQENYTEYIGDESFLADATDATTALWEKVSDLFLKERENGGVLDMDTKVVSTITSHGPGYIEESLEKIVGLQTDAPLKRSLQPFGGIRTAKNAIESYGYEMDPETEFIFNHYRKTHNQGVFDVYTDEMKRARKAGVITGLPDAYGRGRIIGDYRRVPLYGVNVLIEDKVRELKQPVDIMNEATIRHREEISEQIKALKDLIELGEMYGFDLTRPAENAQEAVQWFYLAYLAAVKDQNGAAMSLGRVATFLDIYIERDLNRGEIAEEEAQELIDHFVMKLRLVKFARQPEYNDLFSGDPTWVTEYLGGMGLDGRSLVTKNTYRFIHTLDTMGPSPEPNLTVAWSKDLPENFKRYTAKMSIKTSSLQYENDDLMRPIYGDDYGIACCVSPMKIGKEMQFFGARANLAKALLYALNGGRDDKVLKGQVVVEGIRPFEALLNDEGSYNYQEVLVEFKKVISWLAKLYVNTLNAIHYMHDKYSYEAIQLALHNNHVHRYMATGIAGLSHAVDSLSAIKHGGVEPVVEQGEVVGYTRNGAFPRYGNNDDRVDKIAQELVELFIQEVRKTPTYRDAEHTTSILTITSNVVYGRKTGETPDGRAAGVPFAPGANPSNGADESGALASLMSVAKLDFQHARDGISNTFTIVPKALGRSEDEQIANLVQLMDGYTQSGGYHLNVNVFDRDLLLDAQQHPENYPQLTIRVSGYAVNFVKLTKEQQDDVISRTFHEAR